jgi:hypothetical protein
MIAFDDIPYADQCHYFEQADALINQGYISVDHMLINDESTQRKIIARTIYENSKNHRR